MKLILLQDHKKLGKKGDIVNVSDGFAFNNLIPQGVATPATEQVLIAKERASIQQEATLAKEVDKLKMLADKIDKKKITISARAKGTKLFGSITKTDIAQAVAKEYGVTINQNNILLDTPIKELTTQAVEIDYENGVSASIIVTVVAE